MGGRDSQIGTLDICIWLNKAENQWQSAPNQFWLMVFWCERKPIRICQEVYCDSVDKQTKGLSTFIDILIQFLLFFIIIIRPSRAERDFIEFRNRRKNSLI